MTEQRIIKKYPNRRLYDTAISSYITLEDVKRLVLEQVPLVVIDARSQSDITHSTLLQIIVEQEENGPPLFSNEMLQQMIRFYGGSVPGLFKGMFTQGVALFNQYVGTEKSESPATNELEPTADAAQAEQNWQTFQAQWFERFQQLAIEAKQPTTEAPSETEHEAAATTSSETEY